MSNWYWYGYFSLYFVIFEVVWTKSFFVFGGDPHEKSSTLEARESVPVWESVPECEDGTSEWVTHKTTSSPEDSFGLTFPQIMSIQRRQVGDVYP